MGSWACALEDASSLGLVAIIHLYNYLGRASLGISHVPGRAPNRRRSPELSTEPPVRQQRSDGGAPVRRTLRNHAARVAPDRTSGCTRCDVPVGTRAAGAPGACTD